MDEIYCSFAEIDRNAPLVLTEGIEASWNNHQLLQNV